MAREIQKLGKNAVYAGLGALNKSK